MGKSRYNYIIKESLSQTLFFVENIYEVITFPA